MDYAEHSQPITFLLLLSNAKRDPFGMWMHSSVNWVNHGDFMYLHWMPIVNIELMCLLWMPIIITHVMIIIPSHEAYKY